MFDFTTPAYYLFLPTVLVLGFLVRHHRLRTQLWVLLLGSWLFFWLASGTYLILLLASTIVDFIAGGRIARAESKTVKRVWLMVSLCLNLGVLGFFKYTDFLLGSVNGLSAVLGTPLDLPFLNLLLPIGISFYTFQTMSYSIDMYRGVDQPIDRFVHFALYAAFFPQLVAGPIVRSHEFRDQILTPLELRFDDLKTGATWILYGLAKKLIIADNVARQVGLVFDEGQGLESPLWVMWGALLFGVQIYCDFSAYTDIALGSARMIGIRLPENFDWPYFARSPQEFWQKWHMSLSRWLKDYLYFSLGGSRRGRIRTYVNLMLVMLLGGLWHGAAWNFVVWGGFHGGLLALHRLVYKRPWWVWMRERLGWLWVIGALVVTQYLMFLAWIMFRVGDTATLGQAIASYLFLPALTGNAVWFAGGPTGVMLPALLVLVFVVIHVVSWKTGGLKGHLARLPIWAWVGVMTIVLTLTLLLAPADPVGFIYFRF